MLTKSHLTIATALVVAAIAAPAATAMPADSTPGGANDLPAYATPGDLRTEGSQADVYSSTVTKPDARGEHAASLADDSTAPDSRGGDRRSPDAVEPFVRPVVVEVGEPHSPGFDWISAIIGIAGGLALAVLAGAAVSGARPRHRRARTV
jgi:hypothetical protein